MYIAAWKIKFFVFEKVNDVREKKDNLLMIFFVAKLYKYIFYTTIGLDLSM